ncbi:ATP-binding protein [Pseudomonas lundensis]|uniref:ATP-binding protein n=1 Tax=Pseudomonas lundensis TaxID=86185 RepID=UPI00201636D0|nr:transporter substrate-binding domain-containing protein [Pseudomonas lundensis]
MKTVSARRYALFCLSLCITSVCQADPVDLQLLARSHIDVLPLDLSEGDRQWLTGKAALTLGTSAPDYAPFDISTGSDYFEGVTADYAGLLSHLLQVPFKVRRYASRGDVISALKRGEIDLLGTANGYEMADPQLVFSASYALDTPVLVTRMGDDPRTKALPNGLRLAMLYHYQPVEEVKAAYPQADVQLYASTLSAIGAVAFGQADLYLGDAISTNYLINKNYLNNVYLKDFSSLEGHPFSFAVHHPNPRLLRLINAAMARIPSDEQYAILSRWGVSGMKFEGRGPLHFSPAEQRWIDQNPRLKVAVTEDFLPFNFYDEHGMFSGLAADLLAKISVRTGLKFDLVRSPSVSQLTELISRGEADLTPAFTPSSNRQDVLRFTKPYLTTPFVLVTPLKPGSPATLDELQGKRVALVTDSLMQTYLEQNFPKVNLVSAPNSAHALAMAAKGEVDGAINSLISARYLIKQQYSGRLRIRSTVGVAPAQFALAIHPDAHALYSILGKALTSISPEEMDTLTNRWQSAVVLDNRYWVRNRSTVIKVTLMLLGVLTVGVVWIAYLRGLVQKRDQAERALNDQLAFMRTLIDGTPHPIYVRDREGRLLICNEVYLQAFGVSREAVIGKNLLESTFNPEDQRRVYHTDYLEVMQEGRPVLRDHSLTLPDGKVLTIYHWVLPYRGSDGAVMGIIGGWIDISERQQLVEQLKEAKNHADQANLAKSDFLTTMSHEIRTPMNAVIGMLELAMKKAEQGVADKASINVASEAAHGLLELIGDILDIAQIESGRMSLNQQRTQLMTLVQSTVRVFEGMAQQKGIQMSAELDPKINLDVLIDPLRFRQILSNLLSNAIKFTDAGQVRLSVRARGSEDGERLRLNVQVEDTGIGISISDQKRLFSPFSQVNTRAQKPGGSGLGLMISRQLCDLMGGTLSLNSTVGKGTCITMQFDIVTLLSQTPVAPAPRLPSSNARPLNVLVVDDYPPNRKLLTQQLGYLGHSAIEAEDGAQALKIWRSRHFDMIMTDCAMPVMDGYEMTRSIRAEEAAANNAPILIVGFTANAQIGEAERCLAAGMNDCLFKPISLHSLEARLASAERAPINVQNEQDDAGVTPLIDLEALEHLTGGDANALKNLLEPLIDSLEDDMGGLLNAFTKNDLPGMSEIAHKVKSGARMIKATHLAHCCEQLEKACLSPEWSQLAQRVDEQYEAMAQVLEVIEVYRV